MYVVVRNASGRKEIRAANKHPPPTHKGCVITSRIESSQAQRIESSSPPSSSLLVRSFSLLVRIAILSFVFSSYANLCPKLFQNKKATDMEHSLSTRIRRDSTCRLGYQMEFCHEVHPLFYLPLVLQTLLLRLSSFSVAEILEGTPNDIPAKVTRVSASLISVFPP